MNILLTGGAGYVGSHTAVELVRAGHDVVIVDNFYNSNPTVINQIEKIIDRPVRSYRADVSDKESMTKIFAENKIDGVIHFAGLKAVGESVARPWLYYHVNLGALLNLLDVMNAANCKKLIFSSTAVVYDADAPLPWSEATPTSTPLSPYGASKLMQERILTDLYKSDNSWNITLLRYFNPVGADVTGLIGESPSGIPNNLFPFIMQVAAGIRPELGVFGNDYPTSDGTAVRDYLHVTDLAIGHIKALEKIDGLKTYNLGTGKGHSVLECVKAFETASGQPIPYSIKPRRDGDAPEFYADATKAEAELDWRAEKTLDDMCRDSWKFQTRNMS